MSILTADPLTTNTRTNLVTSEDLRGTPVFNHVHEKLGTIEKAMVDKPSGCVAFAVISFNGAVGTSGTYHPIPWTKLSYDTGKAGYILSLSNEFLKGGPCHDMDEWVNYNDAGWIADIRSYYGVGQA